MASIRVEFNRKHLNIPSHNFHSLRGRDEHRLHIWVILHSGYKDQQRKLLHFHRFLEDNYRSTFPYIISYHPYTEYKSQHPGIWSILLSMVCIRLLMNLHRWNFHKCPHNYHSVNKNHQSILHTGCYCRFNSSHLLLYSWQVDGKILLLRWILQHRASKDDNSYTTNSLSCKVDRSMLAYGDSDLQDNQLRISDSTNSSLSCMKYMNILSQINNAHKALGK